MINNKFDIGKVASDLTSKESLYGLGLTTLTAGLTFGIADKLGIDKLAPGLDMAQRTKIIAQNALINTGVRGALSFGTGEKLTEIVKTEALSGTLALGQSKIGDIAQDKDLKTGSFGKIAMHSGLGSLYSLATGSSALSGAIGGASSELVAGVMESGKGTAGPPLTKEEQQTLNNNIKATTKLTSATVTLLAGGNAKDMTLSANVGESAIQHNLMGHRNKEDDAKVEQLTDEEVQEQYKSLSENSGAVSWLFYNPYEVALEAEHHKRFDSGLDTGIKTQLGNALIVAPGGKFIGAVVEKTTGLDLGVSSQITEPDLTGSRLNIPGKKKDVATKPTTTKLTTNQDSSHLYDSGHSPRIGISAIDGKKDRRVHEVLGSYGKNISAKDFKLQVQAEKALDAHAKKTASGAGKGITTSKGEVSGVGGKGSIPGKQTNVTKVTDGGKSDGVKITTAKDYKTTIKTNGEKESLTTKSRVRNINNRKPINSEYAGKVYPLEKLPESLRQKYPHSVPFNGAGYPDFSRYAVKKVKINVTGNHDIDNSLANKAAGFKVRPENYTWHHHQDSNTMQLVPSDLHKAVRHTGGVANKTK